MDWENHLEKNSIISTEKTVKTENKLPHVHKNRNRENEFPFKHRFLSEFESSTEKIHGAKSLTFSLRCLFRRDKNHYSNLTSKNHGNV